MHSGTEEVTTRWAQEPTGRTVRWTWAKIPLIIWPPPTPIWLLGNHDILSLLKLVSSEPVSSSPWKFWSFPFLSIHSYLSKNCRSLWEGLKDQWYKSFVIHWGPSSREPSLPLIHRDLGLFQGAHRSFQVIFWYLIWEFRFMRSSFLSPLCPVTLKTGQFH